MNAEDLKKLGIEDEAVQKKIIVLHGKGIEKSKTKAIVAEKSAATSLIEIEGLKGQLIDANKTIKGFKKMDIEGIQKSADEWEAKAIKIQEDADEKIKLAKEESDKEIKTLKLDHVLDAALGEAKVKNLKTVRALLKLDDIKLSEDGETLIGLNEQLEPIKADNDYLFEGGEITPKIVKSTKSKGVPGDAVLEAARAAAELPPNEE